MFSYQSCSASAVTHTSFQVKEEDVTTLFPLATVKTAGGSKELELYLAVFQDKGDAANKSKRNSGGVAAGTKTGGKNKSVASCMKKNFDATHARVVGVSTRSQMCCLLELLVPVMFTVWCHRQDSSSCTLHGLMYAVNPSLANGCTTILPFFSFHSKLRQLVHVCAGDASIALDKVIIRHMEERRSGSTASYMKWFREECPKLIPFTTHTHVKVTGQGQFHGGRMAYRNFQKDLRTIYLEQTMEETGEDISSCKVCF
jgi:hypothetical protein